MNIVSKSEFIKLIDSAIDVTKQRIKDFPNYHPYKHAEKQLIKIHDDVVTEKKLTDEEKLLINIGVMAFKTIEDQDPEYADILMKIASIYDDW